MAPTGDLPISFEWMHNNKTIDVFSYGISVSKLGKRISAMTIESINAEHAGNYTCKATNQAASEYYSAHLIVNGTFRGILNLIEFFYHSLHPYLYPFIISVLPLIVPFAFDKGPAKSGQDITITCTVSDGDLPLKINWLLNKRPIEEFSTISTAMFGKRNMVLNIESVTAEHSGNYTCEASNKAGSVSYSTDLRVYGTLQLIIEE